MDELVNLVSQKTGLSKDMAQVAVNTVVGFIKQRMPGPVATQIDAVLTGNQAAGNAEQIAKGLGGMLGKK